MLWATNQTIFSFFVHWYTNQPVSDDNNGGYTHTKHRFTHAQKKNHICKNEPE